MSTLKVNSFGYWITMVCLEWVCILPIVFTFLHFIFRNFFCGVLAGKPISLMKFSQG